MTLRELKDRIETWLKLASEGSIPRTAPPDLSENQGPKYESWTRKLFQSVLEMEIVDEITGTLAEQKLSEAITLARDGKPTSLSRVFRALQKVQAFIARDLRK